MIRQHSKKNRMNQLFDLFDANEDSVNSDDDNAFDRKGNPVRDRSAYHSSSDSVDSSVTDSEANERNIREIPRAKNSREKMQTAAKTLPIGAIAENGMNKREPSPVFPPRPMIRRQVSVIDVPEGETFHLPHDNELRSVGVCSADTSNDDSSDDDNSNNGKNTYDCDDEGSNVVRETDDAQTAFQKRNRQRRKLLSEIASKETTAVVIWRTIAYCVLIVASIFFVVGTTMNTSWHSQRISTESYDLAIHELRELLLSRVRATRMGIVALADEIALTGETESMGTTGSWGTTTSTTNHNLRRISVRQQNRSTNLRSKDDNPQNQQQHRTTKSIQQRVSYLWSTYLFPSASLPSNVSLTTSTSTTSSSNDDANENNLRPKGFPFVTFTLFENHVLDIFESSLRTVEMIAWIPLIEQDQSGRWIEYSQQNLDNWYHQTSSIGSEGEGSNITIKDSIWEYDDTMQALYDEVSELNVSMYKNITHSDNTSIRATHLLTTQSPRKDLHFNFSYYAPIWQTFPRPSSFNHTYNDTTHTNNDVKLLKAVNFDMMSVPTFASIANEYVSSSMVSQSQSNEGLLSPVDPYYGYFINKNLDVTQDEHQQSHDSVLDEGYHFYDMYSLDSSINGNRKELSSLFRPHSLLLQPVLVNAPQEADNFIHNQTNHEVDGERRILVGFLASIISWDSFLVGLVPHKASGIYVVLKNTCGQAYTYLLLDNMVQYIGEGDFHDTDYDTTEEIISVPSSHEVAPKTRNDSTHCLYTFHVYASGEYTGFVQSHDARNFIIVTSFVVLLFAMSFTMYDTVVNRRNIKVVNAALRANHLVSSVFPSHIRNKLLAEPDESERDARSLPAHMVAGNTTGRQRRRQSIGFGESATSLGFGNDFDGDGDDDEMTVFFSSKPPIADLFPETTILFADIAGFTNWSSAREPTQVFTLLETLYHAFDEIAKKRRIYKVETVGDCYVAVAGLPEPRKDHAMAMCRFAKDIVLKMRHLTVALQRRLGPETEDLALRAGLHSGPVTAGVLRGQNSRFQLFGDTMNTAARMEQTGERDKIQLSKETADLVVAGGKPKWISPRADKVFAKGKGDLDTFWLLLRLQDGDGRSISLSGTSETSSRRTEREFADSFVISGVQDKSSSLIDWNVDILSRLLKQIMARRNATPQTNGDTTPDESRYVRNAIRPFDEVCEIITLPKFDAKIIMNQVDPESIELDEIVMIQLHSIVAVISSTYRDNPFHNFEHASHVTLSVVKLLSRIVAPTSVKGEEFDEEGNRTYTADALHDQTYGITSDPLTQFACVFSALIHDCDHPGVPNAQLVNENTAAATHYKNQSIAEQNSVDMVWKILMSDGYRELRNAIYSTDQELLHFRRLVVNCVMATDIVDKELKALRNARWERAFNEAEEEFATYRKATIVIEHLIQASDVAHTMQHWETYRRWNERFFMECYKAYHDGRAEKNPIDGWYQGEIGFFDFYIIPLAKKLNDCGVFGVSSAEYLGYAMKNREEWVARGQEIVGEMAEKVKTTMPNYTDDEFETSKYLPESSVVCNKPNVTSTTVNVVKDTDTSASSHPCDDDDYQRKVPISKISNDHNSSYSVDMGETTTGNSLVQCHDDDNNDDADCVSEVESVTNFFFM